jgi:hypothetical protein
VCSHSWGRWKDILTHGRFKWQLAECDIEVLCRSLLVYCVRHYKGDDKIKSFIWDLITPAKDGHKQDLQNHSGETLTNIPLIQAAIHSFRFGVGGKRTGNMASYVDNTQMNKQDLKSNS